MANRYSSFSNMSGGAHSRSATMPSVSQQVSTTSLLNQLHSAFTARNRYQLEASTSVVVNTWASGNTVDQEIGARAWEHARRRAEDGCIVLASLHRSSPSLFAPFCEALPLSTPNAFYTSLTALRPFLHRVTPFNPSAPCYSSFAAVFNLSLEGELQGASLSLSSSGIDTQTGLVNLPAETGHRAFDVFYFLLTSASSKERDFLGLKPPNQYALLRKSETYATPSYLPTADDAAAAEDWRESLRAIGIKGADFRNMLCVLASILRLGDAVGFLVDQDELETTCEEVGNLLELDPDVLLKKCVTEEREILIAALYEAVVDWVFAKANTAIRSELHNGRAIASGSSSDGGGEPTPHGSEDDAISASVTVVEIPSQSLGKAVSLKTVFDDSTGINAEMKQDGVEFVPAGSSVVREMRDAIALNEPDLNLMGGARGRDREGELDRRQTALEKVGADADPDTFLRRILYPISGDGILLGRHARFTLANVIESSRVWFQLCLHPSDDNPASFAAGASSNAGNAPWSAGSVSSQIRSWRLPEWANHRNKQLDFTADFDIDEFADRYARLGCQAGREGIEAWIMERGWSNGEVVVGHERIWIRESAWWEAESMLDMKPADPSPPQSTMMGIGPGGGGLGGNGLESGYSTLGPNGSGFFAGPMEYSDNASRDNLLPRQNSQIAPSQMGARSLMAPTVQQTLRSVSGGDYGLGRKGDDKHNDVTYEGEVDPELADGKEIEVQKTTFSRRAWVALSYLITWFIPSFLLSSLGRMKRPDVRLAWREKVTIMVLILLLNGVVIFYIVEFGKLLCPNYDKAWNRDEVKYHDGESNFWVSFRGGVYDLDSFWKLQHSDTDIKTTQSNMMPFAGTDVSAYIVPPLWLACPGLVEDKHLQLQSNTTLLYPQASHTSGTIYQSNPTTKLHNNYWYKNTLLPKMKTMYKGELVWNPSKIKSEGEDENHPWFILDGKIYDLTDYFHTLNRMNDLAQYAFFGSQIAEMVQSNPGKDITDDWTSQLNYSMQTTAMNCLNNMFYIGKTDFRLTARCQVQNYLLLSFTIILCVVILTKFLAALQLGSKRRPAQQDKFVICQVPAYTEGEDSLRKGLDSLTALAYDNKRKLICVICDGMIVGGGNDRPTPKIVLDILGVDPKIDPPALPFKSVGQGSEQLNYGKVYSGLYEYEGNVVPYIVVVKVGKESEQSKAKPGNRGKRDSQILLMSFLNRVHHRSPMSPLELEIFHQINNIIGVDPELYEYLFMVDADTKVREDSLNRLVAACANDAKIAGICGETSLENEERSWWTMIQVYEYYISHALSKAFESLFASVTCLPGCFCMYRLRTADKGRPLIISDKVITEYADNDLDTLHKKNLLSLGEDRYLTTLMTKHFPHMAYKFVPDAHALTEAPAEWSVLLSQRRRWINSTVHNLAELFWLKDLCGFCCFSMRFVVFIDLIGTLLLPSVCGYLIYLIYRIASHTGPFPLISVVVLAAVYGLQMIIFIVKRQWQHIGWMIIYLLAYPIWSLILPMYSFWKMDDFSWGSTRIVLGEKGNKKVIAHDDEGYDPRSIPLQRWDDYALQNGLPGRRGLPAEEKGMYQDGGMNVGGAATGYEMDDMHSVYSSVKPASTVLTGFPWANQQQQQQHQQSMYRPPQSPSPFNAMMQQHQRQSTLSRYTDAPGGGVGAAGMMDPRFTTSTTMTPGPFADPVSRHPSRDNLMGAASPTPPPMYHQQSFSQSQSNLDRARSPLVSPGPGPHAAQSSVAWSQRAGIAGSNSNNNLSAFTTQGPTTEAITLAIRECLAEVDLDSVTKKQLKALAEQKLQCQLVGDKRSFLDEQIDFELANM